MGLYKSRHLLGKRTKVKPMIQVKTKYYDSFGSVLWVNLESKDPNITVYNKWDYFRQYFSVKKLVRGFKAFKLNIHSVNDRCRHFQKYERPKYVTI